MPFAFGDQEDDKELMLLFLTQLESFLFRIVHEPYTISDALVFVGDSRFLLRSAWEEQIPAHFEIVRNAVQDADNADLRNAGLTGANLRAKLGILQIWATRLIADGTVRMLRRVLQNINSILGSILQATKVGEIIKEFKEMVENAIDDVRDVTP